jgi:ABC-2 type transport system ATP-binding protein
MSFSVQAGDMFGVIGLNGAGKTTTIKTVLNLKDPISGTIQVLGKERDAKDVKEQVAYLPERFDPPWFLKGSEFIDFSARLYKRSVSRDVIIDYCQKLSLDPAFIDKKVQTYSKGMRQKLGLIATVLTGCSVLILDEPMSGLDPLARALVKDMLMALKSEGRTIILSSHILSDMDEMCDRIAIIHNGALNYLGTPSDFKALKKEQSLERAFLHVVKEDPPRQTELVGRDAA